MSSGTIQTEEGCRLKAFRLHAATTYGWRRLRVWVMPDSPGTAARGSAGTGQTNDFDKGFQHYGTRLTCFSSNLKPIRNTGMRRWSF